MPSAKDGIGVPRGNTYGSVPPPVPTCPPPTESEIAETGNGVRGGDEDEKDNNMELPAALTASDKESFAYPSVKDRLPIIICKVIDLLHRQRLQLNLKDPDSLKSALEGMAKLRYELQTNKPMTAINDGREDEVVWNDYFTRKQNMENDGNGQPPRWFNTCWLYAECYAYRRLIQCMAGSSELRDFDFFAGQKKDSFKDNLTAIEGLASTLECILTANATTASTHADLLASDFRKLMEISLWGNRADLSISAGNKQTVSTSDNVSELRSNLLVDDTSKVWEFLLGARLTGQLDTGEERLMPQALTATHSFGRQNSTSSSTSSNQTSLSLDSSSRSSASEIIVDFVLDNAGFELFSDLCFADFLVSTGLASRIRLRAKARPWFVSDTTKDDIEWMLDSMSDDGCRKIRQACSDTNVQSVTKENLMKRTGQKWKGFLTTGAWTIHSDGFWTYPHDYSLLKDEDPDLYNSLSFASLIIFKGDLNYRKLVADLSWKPTVSFTRALQGFHPAPLVSLRTLKADVIAGLPKGKAEAIAQKDPQWMTTGKYAVIQFCNKRLKR